MHLVGRLDPQLLRLTELRELSLSAWDPIRSEGSMWRGKNRYPKWKGLLDRFLLQPVETCGFFNTQIHNLQGNVQVYNVRIPDGALVNTTIWGR